MPTGSSVAYLDTSALVKLVLAEPQSEGLRDALRAWPRRTSSSLALVELLRAVGRVDRGLEPVALRALTGVHLIVVGERVLRVAARLDPPAIRTLDAVHVATALRVRRSLAAFVSYDRRQLEAAAAAGLRVVSPA